MFDTIRQHWHRGMIIAPDVETTGLNPHKDKVFGISLSIRTDAGVLVSEYEDVRGQEDRISRFLSEVFLQAKWIVNHNIKFDAMFLRAMGVIIPLKKCICSLIRANLIDGKLFEYGLDPISKKYLGEEKLSDIYDELAKQHGGKPTRQAQIENLYKAPISTVAPYANKDTELAYRLYEFQEREIHKQGLEEVDWLERRSFIPVTRMEYEGVRVDIDEAEKAKAKVDTKVKRMEKRLKSLVGNINPNSPKQLTEYFSPVQIKGDWFIRRGTKLLPVGKTPKGAPSWGAETMKNLPLEEARLILDIKSSIKTRDTFIGGHILGHEYKGRVYPTINQVKGDDGGTETGRLSYTEPALQQIPSRNKEVAQIVRPIFLPEEGHGWVYGDLDQHEYRVFAHYAKSPKMLKEYKENPDLDVHQFVSDLTGIPRNMPKDGGANAKQLNLSIVFCMSDGRVAQKLGLPYTVEKTDKGYTFLKPGPEAVKILKEYHKQVPGVKSLQSKVKAKAKAKGFIRTILGRHLRFPNGHGVYKSPGLLFQGSSGDLNKDNMCRVHDILSKSGTGARLLLNIHDEYSLSVPRGEEHLVKQVQEAIQDRKELRVPIRIDFSKPAKNWWLATQKEKT